MCVGVLESKMLMQVNPGKINLAAKDQNHLYPLQTLRKDERSMGQKLLQKGGIPVSPLIYYKISNPY